MQECLYASPPQLTPPHTFPHVFVDPQGVFVLSDNSFRWLSRVPPMSSAAGNPEKEEALREMALLHLHLPCGIIRGGWTSP